MPQVVHQKVSIPMFSFVFRYYIGTSAQIREQHKKLFPHSDNFKPDDLGYIEPESRTLFLDVKSDIGTIAHECHHIKNLLLLHIGQKADADNDEFESYLLDFITNELAKGLRKYIGLKK